MNSTNLSFPKKIYFLITFTTEPSIAIPKFKYDYSFSKFDSKKFAFIEVFVPNQKNELEEIQIFTGTLKYAIRDLDLKYPINFLFCHKMVIAGTNTAFSLNNFDIEDEFNIYFERGNDIKSKDDLTLYFNCLERTCFSILESGNQNSTFSLFLNLYIKKLTNFEINKCIKNIKHIGNLKKIKLDEKSFDATWLFVLYKLLTDFVSFLKNTTDNRIKKLIFQCLDNFPNLINSLDISDYFGLLVNIVTSCDEFNIIFHYIKSINLFVELISDNIEKFVKLFEFEKATINLNYFFKLENQNYEKFDELFYYHLYNIKRNESENFKFFLGYWNYYHLTNEKNELIKLKKIIFYYLITNLKKNKKIMALLEDKNISSYISNFGDKLSNLELIILGEILCATNKFESDLLKILITSINLNTINKNFLKI